MFEQYIMEKKNDLEYTKTLKEIAAYFNASHNNILLKYRQFKDHERIDRPQHRKVQDN